LWQLKPPCVELSQVALRFQGKKAAPKDVVIALESLHQTLKDVTRQDYALDGKLAEYVFFPLSHIFRENKTIPVRATELALQCLQVLISRGWRNSIAPDLAKQLLILLGFLAGGSATEGKTKDVNEELAAAAFSCLGSLFRASDAAGLSSDGSVDATNFPVLGHTVSVLLDGVGSGPSIKVRLGALSALDALLSSISDKEALKSFFPGMVSALTKLLSAGSRSKGSYRTLQGSLDVLTKIIVKVVSDHTNPELAPSESGGQVATVPYDRKDRPKDSWPEVTSTQVKLALANVLLLRYHEQVEVRKALFRLCMSILERCRRSLPQSVPMMIETSVIICTQSSIVDTIELLDNLRIVLTTNSELLESLKSTLHDWIVTLPRVMQSNDDTPKKRTVDQISIALEIISAHGTVSDVLNYAMISNLRASVSAFLQASASKTIQDVAESDVEIDQALRVHQAKEVSVIFPEVMFTKISQSTTVEGLQSLANKISRSTIATTLQRDVIETLRTTSGDEQIATLWLAIQMQSKHEAACNDFDVFLNPSAADPEQSNPVLDDLYAFSLAVLSEQTYTTENDWRHQALSLEAIALQAQQQRQDFRPELVDALYPILERMGSPNAALQRHAVTALSIVSTACSYPTPKDLIIENVDYLVNAVALKLNTFDISPQTPQVLTMMIKLCGATLIPYLDDLVESIFAILECYHGYPKLVEQMFSVLNAIVETANKAASATAITETAEPLPRIQTYKPTSLASLASQLQQARIENPHLDPLPSPPPETNPSPSSPPEEPPQATSTDTPSPLPSPLRTIFSITTLTQHHLPTPSPPLRLLLLNLLPPAFSLLAPHTDNLLPLIHALWPALIARLYDPEAYITTAAAAALTALCKAAGEFLASRFRDEWERIGGLWARCVREAGVERRRMGRVGGLLGRREGAVGGLVLGVVEWVGVGGGMEEGVWEMVEGGAGGGGGREGREADMGERGRGLMEGRGREVLEGLNADMLWLVEERERVRRGGRGLEKLVVEGVVFGDVDL
jgi:hypothetical protein